MHWRDYPYCCRLCGGKSLRPLCSRCGRHEYYHQHQSEPHPCAQCGKLLKNNSARCWSCAGYAGKPRRQRCAACHERWAETGSTFCSLACRLRQQARRHHKYGAGHHCPAKFRPTVEARIERYTQRAEWQLPLFDDTMIAG